MSRDGRLYRLHAAVLELFCEPRRDEWVPLYESIYCIPLISSFPKENLRASRDIHPPHPRTLQTLVKLPNRLDGLQHHEESAT